MIESIKDELLIQIRQKEVTGMQEVILSLFTGIVVGLVFAIIRLPIPAPPALAGVMGIIGIFLGYKIYEWVLPLLQGGGS